MKRYALIAFGGLAALVLTFLGGRYSRPARVEVRTEVVEKVVTVRTRVIETQTQTRWRKVVETKPDGSSVSTEVGETATETKNAENENTTKDTESNTRSVTTANDKKWRLTAQVGVVIPNPQNNFSSPAPTYGAAAEYRLLGPIWIGVWGQTFGAIGASASVEF